MAGVSGEDVSRLGFPVLIFGEQDSPPAHFPVLVPLTVGSDDRVRDDIAFKSLFGCRRVVGQPFQGDCVSKLFVRKRIGRQVVDFSVILASSCVVNPLFQADLDHAIALMFDRVVMDVIAMVLKVDFVANRVFPEPTLPYASATFGVL